MRPSVRAHEKTLVEYTWNSVHPPSKFLRFIVNENHNGINLICIFKGNYKRCKYDLIRKNKGYCWVLFVLLDTFLICKISNKNINVGTSVCLSVRASVHIFKHEYLCNQLADWNEILSEASLGWGKGFSRF